MPMDTAPVPFPPPSPRQPTGTVSALAVPRGFSDVWDDRGAWTHHETQPVPAFIVSTYPLCCRFTRTFFCRLSAQLGCPWVSFQPRGSRESGLLPGAKVQQLVLKFSSLCSSSAWRV